jgi:hypothetical protein
MPSAVYEPRNPEDNPLYEIVASNLETFLALQSERDRPVPRFVERELRNFLDCGVLANGFLRVHCDSCGYDRVVAFSCKGRSVCSSCCGRRMVDTAAHLVDRVFPDVPVRQWVLSLPVAMRYRLAYDAKLTSEVLHIFIQSLFSSLRLRARQRYGIRNADSGGVTFIQRFGGAINLNIHFHTLAFDGVYYEDSEKALCFKKLPPPTDEEVMQVMQRIIKRINRLLERRGVGPQSDPDDVDPLLTEQPLLAELYGASVQGRVGTGSKAGERIATAGFEEEFASKKSGHRCANLSGFSLHANVGIPARARHQLEMLCRYVARPPIAMERLSKLPDGRVIYQLRHKWHNGATHMIFEPLDLIGKLAALVPPPRFNLIRYQGVLAPASRLRSSVVPSAAIDEEKGNTAHSAKHQPDNSEQQPETKAPHPRNYCWAELMKRVFGFDVLKCSACGGRMRILCAINPPDAIRKILECLGLPSKPPPISTAILTSPYE